MSRIEEMVKQLSYNELRMIFEKEANPFNKSGVIGEDCELRRMSKEIYLGNDKARLLQTNADGIFHEIALRAINGTWE
jgi:hypothetical protein